MREHKVKGEQAPHGLAKGNSGLERLRDETDGGYVEKGPGQWLFQTIGPLLSGETLGSPVTNKTTDILGPSPASL